MKKTVWLIILSVLILLTGVMVAGAAKDEIFVQTTMESGQAKIKLEISILKKLNELKLSKEQTGKIISALENFQTKSAKIEESCQALLNQEKNLLLETKPDPEKIVKVENDIRAKRDETKLLSAALKKELDAILTNEQTAKFEKIMGENKIFLQKGLRIKKGGNRMLDKKEIFLMPPVAHGLEQILELLKLKYAKM